MKMMIFLRGCIAIGILVFAGQASATLIGSTVNMSAFYPDSSLVYSNPGNAVISEGVEYVAGSYTGFSTSWQIDISANQLTITDTQFKGFPFAAMTFNGWILDVISGPSILSATVDASSGFSPFAITVIGGDLLLNYQGVQGPIGATSVINFVTESAVPEPITFGLFGLGLAGLCCSRRKKI